MRQKNKSNLISFKHRYFSSFISGTYEIVKEAIKSYFSDSTVEFHSNDLVLYTTTTSADKAQVCPFFNNTFVHIKQFNSANFYTIENQLNWAIEKDTFIEQIVNFFGDRKFNFRIVCSRDNQTVSVDRNLLNEVENKIKHFTNLRLHKTKPDYEIWFIEKREKYGMCGIRISRHPDYQEVLERGELRSELAYLMNYLSQPDRTDIYWDPFCGTGALGINRAVHFPYTKVLCSDINVNRAKQKLNSHNQSFKNFKIEELDFFNQSHSSKVNKIVTDPPWGEANAINDIEEFYSKIFDRFDDHLDKNGIIVLLTSKEEIVDKILERKNGKFKLDKKYKIYIGGKVAFIYKILKV